MAVTLQPSTLRPAALELVLVLSVLLRSSGLPSTKAGVLAEAISRSSAEDASCSAPGVHPQPAAAQDPITMPEGEDTVALLAVASHVHRHRKSGRRGGHGTPANDQQEAAGAAVAEVPEATAKLSRSVFVTSVTVDAQGASTPGIIDDALVLTQMPKATNSRPASSVAYYEEVKDPMPARAFGALGPTAASLADPAWFEPPRSFSWQSGIAVVMRKFIAVVTFAKALPTAWTLPASLFCALLASFGLVLRFMGRKERAAESLVQDTADTAKAKPDTAKLMKEMALNGLGKKGRAASCKGKDELESSDDEDAAYDCNIQVDEDEPECEAELIDLPFGVNAETVRAEPLEIAS